MKKTIILFVFVSTHLVCFSQDREKLYEIAKNYLKEGDYANAEMLLSKVYDADTLNKEVRRDLSVCYYSQNDFDKALNLVRPIIENETADELYYVLASNIYKAIGENKEQEKILKSGLKKYSSSGELNNELGNLLNKQNNKEAITFWEAGIEKDPAFSKNYFDACIYYHANNEILWSVLYAEIFLNMDPLNVKNAELKEILLSNYKKLLNEISGGGFQKEKNDFLKKIIRNLRKQVNSPEEEVNTATLVKIRTKFILSWFNDNPEKTPFYLFEFQRNLLQNGMFDAYNQWLFGSSENLVQFHRWVRLHENEYDAFIRFQKSFPLSIPQGQYYH